MNKEIYKPTVFLRELCGYVFIFILPIIITIFINKYVLTRADIEGTSMLATLQNNDITFVEKLSLITHSFKRGEIVIFKSNNKNNDIYIKRIIGLEGDKIKISTGKVYLNNKLLQETYLPSYTITDTGPYLGSKTITIPKGFVFVLGDNRLESFDSRFFGVVNIKDIQGHAIIRIYPFNTMTLL